MCGRLLVWLRVIMPSLINKASPFYKKAAKFYVYPFLKSTPYKDTRAPALRKYVTIWPTVNLYSWWRRWNQVLEDMGVFAYGSVFFQHLCVKVMPVPGGLPVDMQLLLEGMIQQRLSSSAYSSGFIDSTEYEYDIGRRLKISIAHHESMRHRDDSDVYARLTLRAVDCEGILLKAVITKRGVERVYINGCLSERQLGDPGLLEEMCGIHVKEYKKSQEACACYLAVYRAGDCLPAAQSHNEIAR